MDITVIVNANHVAEHYRAVNKPILVREDGHGQFYAQAQPYGCGKSCNTIKAAVYDLLLANGCTSIHIQGEG